MRLQRNYYEVLGLPRTASPAEIKKQYHNLARQFHPDRAKDKELAQRLFVQINQAYQTLSDAEKRSQYDAGLVMQLQSNQSHAPQAATMSQPVFSQAPPVQSPANGYASSRQTAPDPSVANQALLNEWLNQANNAFLGGDWKRAAQLCQQVLHADASKLAAHILMGDIHAEQGEMELARECYTRVLDLQPQNWVAKQKIERIRLQSKIHSMAQTPSSNGTAPAQREMASKPAEPVGKRNLFQRLMGKSR